MCHHILAFEAKEDKAIFDGFISLVLHCATIVPQQEPPQLVFIELDPKDEEVPIQRIMKTSRFNK